MFGEGIEAERLSIERKRSKFGWVKFCSFKCAGYWIVGVLLSIIRVTVSSYLFIF
jgi:hypothetical protein